MYYVIEHPGTQNEEIWPKAFNSTREAEAFGRREYIGVYADIEWSVVEKKEFPLTKGFWEVCRGHERVYTRYVRIGDTTVYSDEVLCQQPTKWLAERACQYYQDRFLEK